MARQKRKYTKKKYLDREKLPVPIISAREIIGSEAYDAIKNEPRHGKQKAEYLDILADNLGFTEATNKILSINNKQSITSWRVNNPLFNEAMLDIKSYYMTPLYIKTYEEAMDAENWKQREYLMKFQPVGLGDPLFEMSEIDFTKGDVTKQLMQAFMKAATTTRDINFAKTMMVMLQDTALKYDKMLLENAKNEDENEEPLIVDTDELMQAISLVKKQDTEAVERELNYAHLKPPVREKKKNIKEQLRAYRDVQDAEIDNDNDEE